MSIDAYSLDLLRKELADKFIPLLPPLLNNTHPVDQLEKKNLSRAFSAFVLSHICDLLPDITAQSIVDDFDDNGIDAILYHGDTIYIVQSKLKESEQFKQEEAQALCAGLRKLIAANFSGFNQHVLKRQTEIEGALENCSKIQIIIAHVGSGISQHAKDAINQFAADDSLDEERLVPSYIDIDFQQVKNYLLNGNAYDRVDAKIWLECYKSIGAPRLSYFGLANLKDLVELHQKHHNGLYEKNIRTFLGMGLKQGVNEAIQETLRNAPEDFCYLNNGVTALCHVIEPKNSKNGKKQFRISGLSVINGAQTISSSAYALAKGADISKAKVMLTLIKADTDTEFGKEVTKARNHQNPVSLSDFVALEEDQERLRREAAYLKIQYDYKPGAPEALFDPDRINITEALYALALTSEDPRYAVWLKKEPANLFLTKSEAYKGIFNPNLKIHTLINAVRFYRYIQELMQPQIVVATGQERLTYKHGTYVLGWILAKRMTSIIQSTTLIEETVIAKCLSIPFDEIRNAMWDVVQPLLVEKGPLALFRNQTHTIPLMQNIMLKHYGLLEDPVIPHKQSEHTDKQAYPIALFSYMLLKAPQIKAE